MLYEEGRLEEKGNRPVPGQLIFAKGGGVAVTAAEANVIRGRLMTPQGAPIGDAQVTLLNGKKYVGTSVTGQGGTFEFSRLETGQTYTIIAESKRYRFRPVTVGLTDNVVAVEIIANQ